jgi:molybdopterin-containing oxidoreductase family membrane subunit
MGRPWLAYWVLPFQINLVLFVNFNSPLLWDVFAFQHTYQYHLFLVDWLLPDFAMLRDRAITFNKKSLFYFSFGWR